MSKVFLTGSTSYVGTKFAEMYGSQFDILGVSRTDQEHPVDMLAFDALKKLFNDFQPDFILHLAADVGRDATTSDDITVTNPAIVQNLISLALPNKTPFIFTSTEAVYGNKEQEGGYVERDPYKPRSPYGASKVASEKLLMASGLPYLVTRGHRHVGISRNFNRAKQFPDSLRELTDGQTVHLDSHKIFTPVLINNVCDIFTHYMAHDPEKQVVINIGVDKPTTYYDFFADVAKTLGISAELLKPDGEEAGWLPNSSLSMEKLKALGYPVVSYQQMLETIKADTITQ